MYRTVYSTKLNGGLIQILHFGFIWCSIRNYPADPPILFDTLDHAEAFIEDVGIDRQYKRQTPTIHPAAAPVTEGEKQ